MAPFRFIHTSDLHLGRRFGTYPEDIRGRLVEARHTAIHRIADVAWSRQARDVLVAGDVFDTETPSESVMRQALVAMQLAEGVHWWIIPGNHDSLAAEPLWDRFREHAPENVHLIDTPKPIELALGVVLLPAPATHRYTGDDLTAWMSGSATEGKVRIGLAHGSVTTFGGEESGLETIPPDRASSADLDYLALGDWHGYVRIDSRTYYCGAPERDRFKHSGRGICLAVTIDGPRAVPVVEQVEIGRFDWTEINLELVPSQDAAQALRDTLPHGAVRRDRLLRINANGYVGMGDHERLKQAAATVGPEFGYFDLCDDGLSIECDEVELDHIAKRGALRMAADRLYDDSKQAYVEEDRRIAMAALQRLYSFTNAAER